MKPPRGLSAEEAAAWAQVATTVKRFHPPRNGEGDRAKRGGGESACPATTQPPHLAPTPVRQPPLARRLPPPRSGEETPTPQGGLDASWDRKLARGTLSPDFTLDLHGHTLDQAHGRLIDGVGQARAMGARVVLLITGKPRPAEAADRGTRRGAIRAKVLDWLAASSHGPAIASIRTAHIRHGGDGALYVVLKRAR